MIERIVRWVIRRFLPGYTLAKIGKRAKKEDGKNDEASVS